MCLLGRSRSRQANRLILLRRVIVVQRHTNFAICSPRRVCKKSFRRVIPAGAAFQRSLVPDEFSRWSDTLAQTIREHFFSGPVNKRWMVSNEMHRFSESAAEASSRRPAYRAEFETQAGKGLLQRHRRKADVLLAAWSTLKAHARPLRCCTRRRNRPAL
jgi:hypothetical protein